jgi:hypothetical protein
MSKTGKRIGRPPKKGTMLANSSLGSMAPGPGEKKDFSSSDHLRRSPLSSPERDHDDFGIKRRKTSTHQR